MKRSKSFLWELFLKMIIILCVPMITIFLVSWQAHHILRKEVMLSAEKSLNIFTTQMDVIMEDTKNICLSLIQNEDSYELINSYARSTSKEHSLRLQLIQLLMKEKKDEYHDFFIYFHNNDRIISGYFGSQKAKDYYEAYYADLGVSYDEEFRRIIQNEKSEFSCHAMNMKGDNTYLCVTMGNRNEVRKNLNYTICIVCNPKKMENIFSTGDLDDRGGIQLYNAEQEILWNETSEWVESISIQNFSSAKDEWIESDDYVYMIKNAKENNSYVYIVEKDYFWRTLEQLNRISVISIIVCIFVSIILILVNSHMMYQPLKNIVAQLKGEEEAKIKNERNEEFLYISNYIYDEKERSKKVKKVLHRLLLYKLLVGKYVPTDLEQLEKEIFVKGSNYLVCIIRMEAMEDQDLYSFVVQNVFEEICKDIGEIYCVETHDGSVVLIINATVRTDEVWDILKRGMEYCSRNFCVVLTIGCSKWHEDISCISDAYKEAMDSIEYKYLLGTGIQIRYEEMLSKKEQYRDGTFEKVLLLLLDYVRGETKLTAEEIVEVSEGIYSLNRSCSLEESLLFRNGVISAFEKVLDICNYTENRDEMLKSLQTAGTKDDFRKQYLNKLSDIKRYCASHVKYKEKYEICVKAMSYINENYNDCMLSVNILGEKMGVQPAYLSKLFKEKFGVSILDCISSVRIDHAKRLLCESDKMIQEIAEMTGFLSSHVFIKKFKEIVGMTPGKYREINTNRQE